MPPPLNIVLSIATDMSVLTVCWPGPGRGRAEEVHQEDLRAAAGARGQAGHAAQATRQAAQRPLQPRGAPGGPAHPGLLGLRPRQPRKVEQRGEVVS